MPFGKKAAVPEEVPVEDPTAWMLDNPFTTFFIMHTNEIKYMCMLGYTFLHGHKVFSQLGPSVAPSYKFITMLMACTGGGILVPIFINNIPVPLAQDAYPIAIMTSFAIHHYFPVLREVMGMSGIMKTFVVVLYETLRAYVVVLMTCASADKISPSLFSFPLFGPIFCGTIGGCGGAFLPLNKGLDPIKSGLSSPMLSAFFAATCLHLFLSTPLSEGVIDAKKKGHVHVVVFFIGVGLINAFGLSANKPAAHAAKKEK